MRLSGLSPDGSLVEMIELPDHPWFVAASSTRSCKSRPTRPHPLFAGFVGAAAKHQAGPAAARRTRAPRSPRPTDVPATFPPTAVPHRRTVRQLEDDALNLRVADHLARLAERVPGGIIFKASFDKANRSNAGAHRGPGLEAGLAALARVRARTGLPVLTDVHEASQCADRRRWSDVLQIPPSSAGRPTCSRPPAPRASR
jgi:hypothetical protein